MSMTMGTLSGLLKAVTMTTEKKGLDEPCVHGVLYTQRAHDPFTGFNTSGRTLALRFAAPITNREWHEMKNRILDEGRLDFEADFDNKTKAVRWILEGMER